MKNAILISCFDYYEIRIKYIQKYLIEQGYEIIYITSDFDHINKKKKIHTQDNTLLIKTIPYYKNISIMRVISHFIFSYKVKKKILDLNPDLIYAIIPPNSLVKFLSKYKYDNKNVKLIYDVYDMWPETMPIQKINDNYKIFLKTWANIRDKYLNDADIIFTECNLFKKLLIDNANKNKIHTLYLTTQNYNPKINCNININKLNICYLGSINNIIDIDMIIKFLSKLNKFRNVKLHIIGKGENKDNFINELKNNNIEIKYYGAIFDNDKKQKIFDKCVFGLNIMKSNVCIGLTMKSLNYFQGNLPIINNIKYDTEYFVKKYNVGYNLSYDNIDKVVELISSCKEEDFQKLKYNTNMLYNKIFTEDNFNKKLQKIMYKK